MQQDEKLHTPKAFFKNFSEHFPVGALKTFSALKYHMTRRAENRLLDAGAVVETQFGLMIHPARFLKWMLIERPAELARDQDVA
jgi:hypothetical protein